MKKIMMALGVLLLTGSAAVQAQSTSSENNANNSAQSKSGTSNSGSTNEAKSKTTVTRTVTGARSENTSPESNSTADRFGKNKQTSREKRDLPASDADGGTSVIKGRPKADPKTKAKRGSDRSFGNTGNN
ncbi:hypothetical protein ACO2Q8_16485 [Larkinella sp. VNQ87]|uniref:hypothetical protein n=1 Tax=Larkinella sp. VNQ87 TaxID=3400921 RepID=UPI003C052CFC